MKTVFSGLKPSGDMTIGNYLGAMKHWPVGQESQRSIFFVPNLHAITVRQDATLLKSRTYDLVAWLLAVGVDPKQSVILVQSKVSAHAELAWILNNYVTMGELSRMTQFKDKSQKAGPEGQLVGLFDYPVLMAADILLYQADEVPVGEDQKQHVELTRDIATRFNNLYGEVFTLPKATIPKVAARIMSLDDPTVKMSKSSDSEDSYIALADSPEAVERKIKRAVTDSDGVVRYDKAAKPGIANLLDIYSVFSDQPIKAIEAQYDGKGYGDFKKGLIEVVNRELEILQSKFSEYRSNKAALDEVIEEGSVAAAEIANDTLAQVKKRVGLL